MTATGASLAGRAARLAAQADRVAFCQQPHPRVDTITDRASPEQVLDELAGALQQPYVSA